MSSAYAFAAAADTTNMQAGGASMFSKSFDFATKGLGAAALSGVYSIYNTAVDAANMFGANAERANVASTLASVDEGWASYYTANKETIDAAGFFMGSLAPGLLAVKGLKLAQAGVMGGQFKNVLGFASTRETLYLEKALQEIGTKGGTVFQRINANKMASIGWGVADNVLQTAAYEIATAVTMKASPMLDSESIADISWDIVKTSAFGGIVGGGINGLFTNKLLKNAGKEVDKKMREYDVLKMTGDTSVEFGDSAFGIINAIIDLPPEAHNLTVKLSHGRKNLTSELDITGLANSTRKDSVARGITHLENKLAHVVANDKTVGLPFAQSMMALVKEGLETGIPAEAQKMKLLDYLGNLHSVEGLGNRPLDVSGELRYLDKTGSVAKKGAAVFSTKPIKDAPIFRVIGDESQAKQAVLGLDAMTHEEAFLKGFDTSIDPTTQQLRVSHLSQIYKKVDEKEAAYAPLFFNTTTREVTETAVPTIADVQTLKNGITASIDGITSGDKTFVMRVSSFERPKDTLEATGRHLWAHQLPKVFGQVDSRDIAVLNAVVNPQSASKVDPLLTIWDDATKSSVLFKDIQDPQAFLFKQKMAVLQEEIAKGVTDNRELAYRLNTTVDWVEHAVATNVDLKAMYQHPGWKQSAERFGQRENLILRYNKDGLTNAPHVANGLVAWQTRVSEAMNRNITATRTVLGQAAHDMLIAFKSGITGEADSQLVGAGMLSASNAGYGDKMRAWAQYTGQIVSKIANDRITPVLQTLQSPAAKLLQTPKAAAEVSSAMTMMRLSEKRWSVYFAALENKYMLVDTESFKQIKYKGAVPAFKERIDLSEEAGKFLQTHHDLYSQRLQQESVLKTAAGLEHRVDPDQFYVPPVDTQRVPFFAFVRQSDGTMFGSSEVAMLTARDAAELENLAAEVRKNPQLRVLFKSDGEEFHKAKFDYDFDRVMNSPTINSSLKSTKSLGTYLPNMTPEAVVEDFVNYHQRMETKLVRDAVSVNYAQTFKEMQDLSERYTAAQTSKFEGWTAALQRNVQDPFGDALKLALNVSKRGEFTLWHNANEFVDALGVRAFRGIEKSMLQARGGQITWQEANNQLQKFGLGAHFTDKEAFEVAQTASDRNLIKTALQKANMLLATGMLRLDWANSVLNMISTPIMLGTEVSAIRNSLKNDPVMFAQFNEMLSTAVPGADIRVPSATKLIYNAVASLVKDGPQGAFMKRYRDIGAVKDAAALYHEMVDDLSLMPKMIPNKYAEKVNEWVEKGAKITFSNWAEDATRYVSANVMHQITEPLVIAGKMSIPEQNAFISIFVNRVQGNYVASQRPILFQGTLGSAVGLFQTYQFNLFQQLFRHIENKDLKTIAVMGGLQGTLFGMNGLPLFDAINTQLVGGASINEGHNDAYSYAVKAAGKDVGDWLMYGTASAMPLWSEQAPALWTRGDLNPRSTFIIPTSPTEVPAIQATLKIISNVLNMAQQVGQGAAPMDALLFGLEHNGWNRPLTGLAQIVKGNATTSHGDLLSASQDWFSIANASRLIGAKPMDESLAVSTVFRSRAYQAMDKERIDFLGQMVKEKLRGNQQLTSEDWTELQGKYAASGGRIEGFARAVQRWDKASNKSMVNTLMEHHNTPAGKRMVEVLGGEALPDYRDIPLE